MESEYDIPQIEVHSQLPKPWEQEESFSDVLYDWMSRAPWLALSVAAHLIVFLIVQAFPWDALRRKPEAEPFTARTEQPEEVFEEPPEEIIEETIVEEVVEEPILQDIEISESVDLAEGLPSETEGDPLFDSPFDKDTPWTNDVIGIGGGGGPKGGRFGKGGKGKGGTSGTHRAVTSGLRWLASHQSPRGSWSPDAFAYENEAAAHTGNCGCDGAGYAHHEVGLTGLALLAFLGDGHTLRRGGHKQIVSRGIRWLKDQQDLETGLIGTRTGHDWIYNHAIATLALCEAYYFERAPWLKRPAQKALDFISNARHPYGVWRYDAPSIGDGDTSITGWMVFALKAGEEAGLVVPRDAFAASLAWFDDMTDPATGRVGYDNQGSPASRAPRIEHGRDGDESMTAVALLCRFFLGQDPDEHEVMEHHAQLLLQSLPEHYPGEDAAKNTNFMYYWYYGSYAMYQMGGKYWSRWNAAMKDALLDSQRRDGHFDGSWDGDGPWGHAGGRVYATASMVLCLEVYFRYSKVLGAR